MNIVVIGANGYVGRRLCIMAEDYGSVVGTSRKPTGNQLAYGLGDDARILPIQRGDVVVLTSAISSPDVCENDIAYARKINVVATEKLVAHCLSIGAKVVFFSSDTVYGNHHGWCDEKTPCQPIGAYAGMKYELEQRFVGDSNFKALRLSYIFSLEDSFTRYLYSCAAKGEVACVFSPFRRMMVYRDDVVRGVLALTKNWDRFPQQIINVGGPSSIDRSEFVCCVQRTLLPQLNYVNTEPPSDFFDKRPREILMSSSVFFKLLENEPLGMDEAIRKEIERVR